MSRAFFDVRAMFGPGFLQLLEAALGALLFSRRLRNPLRLGPVFGHPVQGPPQVCFAVEQALFIGALEPALGQGGLCSAPQADSSESRASAVPRRGRRLRASIDPAGSDMGPWIQVSGMSPRTTGIEAFSARRASEKSDRRPMRIFTPGSLALASAKRASTSSGLGGPSLSPVWMRGQPRAIRPIGRRNEPRAVSFGRIHGQEGANPSGPSHQKRAGTRGELLGGVAAEMEEIDAGGREERGQDPGMRRDVGHFSLRAAGAGRPSARGARKKGARGPGLRARRAPCAG